jgi:hypothetical protein
LRISYINPRRPLEKAAAQVQTVTCYQPGNDQADRAKRGNRLQNIAIG